jgi:hypothetical protein
MATRAVGAGRDVTRGCCANGRPGCHPAVTLDVGAARRLRRRAPRLPVPQGGRADRPRGWDYCVVLAAGTGADLARWLCFR